MVWSDIIGDIENRVRLVDSSNRRGAHYNRCGWRRLGGLTKKVKGLQKRRRHINATSQSKERYAVRSFSHGQVFILEPAEVKKGAGRSRRPSTHIPVWVQL